MSGNYRDKDNIDSLYKRERISAIAKWFTDSKWFTKEEKNVGHDERFTD